MVNFFYLKLGEFGTNCVIPYFYLQAPILRSYPLEITIVFFFILFGAIQRVAVALSVVKDSYAKLKPDFELITIASYSC